MVQSRAMVGFLSRENIGLNLADQADTGKILGVRILKHNKIQVVVVNDSMDDITADVPRKVSLYYYGIIIMVSLLWFPGFA